MNDLGRLTLLVGAIAGALLGGCGESKPFEIAYERPAKVMIPANVKKVAIAEFGTHGVKDRKYSEIASDRLASDLKASNEKYQRYVLYDRKRLGEIMRERDIQLAISDTTSAVKLGKIAAVDAMIYGTVQTAEDRSTQMRTIIDPISQTTREKPYTKLACMTAVTFTMDDVGSSRTLATLAVSKSYDSEKDPNGSGFGAAFGFGSDKIPATETVVDALIAECVKDFMAQISPHEEVIKVLLETGKSSQVRDGNKLALGKEYDEALRCYLDGIKEKADDHGAMFNAALMYEAKKELKSAEDMYTKAIGLKKEDKYIECRKRVRAEMKNSG